MCITPKQPKIQPPPPVPEEKDAEDIARDTRARLRARGGRREDIATSPLGDTGFGQEEQRQRRVLLGVNSGPN